MNNEALNLYVKTKKDWDKRSSVRTSKEIYDLNLNDINSENTNWHFSTYCPILQHKNLKSLSEPQKKSIMGAQLLEFLIKTTRFEVDHVNKVANNLALEKYDFNIPKILKLDALKIYTDEGYHAYFSKKISDQIIDYFAIKDDLTPYIISFFNKVDNIGSKYDKKFNYLANLSSVIVSESMICGDISEEMKGIVYEL